MNNMKPASRLTFTSIILILSILACNLPGTSEQVPSPSDVQTAAALTVQALLTPLVTATVQQQAILPVTPTITMTSASTGTITPTYSVPMLTVREQTNCREGPSLDYEVLFAYLPNKKLEIIGRYDPNNYWLVKSADSPTGSCWMWGEYVEVSGSYWGVPTLTPPPTATLAPPIAPSINKWDFYCNAVTGNMDVTIKWTDQATNETGYRVIRDNGVIAELPAGSSIYIETIPLGAGESVTYYIEVYNVTGSVRSVPIKLTC
jgi:hypothetical protein